ncbi:hypothetical protein NDU88_003778 [Pleurodeles waltl]|uniref:Glutamine amidotransferase type-2 domain-containing protein n=1 Tax=Pleurodeles waltl TaxID=8319 RepID=A0AAV7UG63_PLEWA|nr:hypothetical protein NDU88_003778 [Pleurodeles waltl]
MHNGTLHFLDLLRDLSEIHPQEIDLHRHRLYLPLEGHPGALYSCEKIRSQRHPRHTQNILRPHRSHLALWQGHRLGVFVNGIPLRCRRLPVPPYTAAGRNPWGVGTMSSPDGEQAYLKGATPLGVAGVVARLRTAPATW